jgi:hypothetical protein
LAEHFDTFGIHDVLVTAACQELTPFWGMVYDDNNNDKTMRTTTTMTVMTTMTDGSSGDDVNNNNSRVCILFTSKFYYETRL